MPVYKLREEMPYDELSGWFSYFEQRPIGWREDDRAFKLMQATSMIKGLKPEAVFSSLAKLKEINDIEKAEREAGQITMSELRGSTFFNKMMRSVGGDKLAILGGKNDVKTVSEGDSGNNKSSSEEG